MIHALRCLRDTLGGGWELFRLGCITRFRMRGAYWSWRMATAYGRGRPSRGQMLRDVLEHARWVHRSRRWM